MVLEFIQPLTDISTKNPLGEGGGARSALKATNVTAIFESIV
jgi:hypothetical protein